MPNSLHILQIGQEDFRERYAVPENMVWHYFPLGTENKVIKDAMKAVGIRSFTATIATSQAALRELLPLRKALIPYAIFYDETLELTDSEVARFVKEMCAVPTSFLQPQDLLDILSKALFRSQYGDKLFPFFTEKHPNFKGDMRYNGHESVTLTGLFGEHFQPTVLWTYNIRASKDNPIELWLEYEKKGDCDCQLILRVIPEGSVADIAKHYVVSEEDMANGAIVLDEDMTFMLSATLEVRGTGSVTVGNLHQRWTRFQFGKYVLGGGILHDDKRQEINYFFYPGDFKPPLSVYFSGFRPAEGFEGFGMMRAMGTPFLLFSDPRLLGGAFYMGSDALEASITKTIQHYLDYLGFDKRQLILSGMSMGTNPAMYYGADFEPHAIITAKPLANIGTIASRARLLAPEVFETGIDVLHLQENAVDEAASQALDQKFWDKFNQADFSQTTFGFSYMKDEDMDPTAYDDVTKALYHSGARILSKGTSGRHNDDSATASAWFMNFYRMILENDFGRKFS